jgi:SAM-dependent methyltransferase
MTIASDASDFGREYFETAYRDYDRQNPRRKLLAYRELVAHYAPSKPRPAILELGCAFGRFLGCLDSKWRKFGVDVSQFGIQQARKVAPEAGLVVGSCAALPVSGRFDVIVAFDVFEHIEPLEAVAKSVSELLLDGGVLIFVVPVYDGPLGGLVRVLDHDPTHIHKRSRAFWLSWISQRLVLRDWFGLTRYLLPGGFYVNWMSRSLRRLSPAIAVVAHKGGVPLRQSEPLR